MLQLHSVEEVTQELSVDVFVSPEAGFALQHTLLECWRAAAWEPKAA